MRNANCRMPKDGDQTRFKTRQFGIAALVLAMVAACFLLSYFRWVGLGPLIVVILLAPICLLAGQAATGNRRAMILLVIYASLLALVFNKYWGLQFV